MDCDTWERGVSPGQRSKYTFYSCKSLSLIYFYNILLLRIIWLIVMSLAFWGIIFVSLMIQKRFDESLLSTVVETTNYHISEVSFPAVTLCNHHRVNFDKFESAVEKFLPNTTTENRDTFLVLLKALEVLDFGSFDELEDLLGRDIHDLVHLNLRDVVAFVGKGIT